MADFYVEYPAQGGGGSGADTTLSNLTSPTSVNQSLVPQTNNVLDLGSSTKRFKDALLSGVVEVATYDTNSIMGILYGNNPLNDPPTAMHIHLSRENYGNFNKLFAGDTWFGSQGGNLLISSYNAFDGNAAKDINFQNGPVNAAYSLSIKATEVSSFVKLNLNNHLISNVTNPVDAQDAATKNYVDTNAVNSALSNLTTTSINANLIPNAAGTLTLGNSGLQWSTLYSDNAFLSRLNINTTVNLFAFQARANPDNIAMRLYANNESFRSDFERNTTALTINAYDDANGVYQNIRLDGNNIELNAVTNVDFKVANTVILDVQPDVVVSNFPLDLTNNLINNVADPISAQDAATKAYVDSVVPVVLTKIVAKAHPTAANNTAANNPFNFDTIDYDPSGTITTGTGWKFTAPRTGKYHIHGRVYLGGASYNLNLFLNGTATTSVGYHVTNQGGNFSVTMALTAGDFVDIRTPDASNTNFSGTGGLTLAQTSHIEIESVD